MCLSFDSSILYGLSVWGKIEEVVVALVFNDNSSCGIFFVLN